MERSPKELLDGAAYGRSAGAPRGAMNMLGKAGRAMKANPRMTGGAAIGGAGAMGIRHMRKRGSQNYPMY